MRRILIAITITLAFHPAAYADQKREIAKCAEKESDAARLICYDKLAESLGVDEPVTTSTKGSGEWSVTTRRSLIDDSTNVYLSVQSEETVRSGYNTVRPSLHVRCKENTTNVFLTWNLYLGLDETRMLTRFDKAKATTKTWSISTDNKAVFVRGSDIGFAKRMMRHEKLLTQITPYGESPVVATFKIGGLSEAIKPLRNACHW
ncbi:type VI secretion system protein VasI [Chromohalobacter canadensis]|uniref:Type VI secretion system protein VasI n=1 Tax=Chromohalobacter canadensis TaxID=141389 RepID=A0A285VBE7_9GAMM|nr:type VI secretion system-associated protein TagO [Chromohalobacter canadensis]SOC51452.1 type VI secretion system protein VasI [Chromohalobacter canadensis]